MTSTRDGTQVTLDIQAIDSFYGELQVLRKASLKLHEGEVVALFGPNGHGKSMQYSSETTGSKQHV